MTVRRVRAATIQMETQLADIIGNIAQAAELAEKALKAGAQIVALPEFFTTKIVLDDRLFGCSLAVENDALRMMQSLALSYGATIGGSYLEFDDGDVYNSYVLVAPDGSVSKHRKDLPTMAENAYYIGGSHWWSAPEWGIARSYFGYHAKLNADHMFRAPGRFAKMVGAPMLHGAHCGVLEGQYALTSRSRWSVPVRTHLVGETQIVDGSGVIRARRSADEGAGFILAEIVTGKRPPEMEVPDTFWLENFPPLVRMMWTTQNSACRSLYQRAKTDGKIRPFSAGAAAEQQTPAHQPRTKATKSKLHPSEIAT
jgi:Carbon-nitrogen hydrolase